MLPACLVHCWYLAVTSKGWFGYGLSRCGCTVWHITTVRSSRLLYIDDASGSRNKLGMLPAFSVHCQYLAVTSKGWYGYSLSRFEQTIWHITTVRSSRLLYIHDASGSHNKLVTPWCNAHRILLCCEAWDESSDRNSVWCQSLAALWRYGTR
jgi:hypothetical protein